MDFFLKLSIACGKGLRSKGIALSIFGSVSFILSSYIEFHSQTLCCILFFPHDVRCNLDEQILRLHQNIVGTTDLDATYFASTWYGCSDFACCGLMRGLLISWSGAIMVDFSGFESGYDRYYIHDAIVEFFTV